MDESKECGTCAWNDDGLCDRIGKFVDDDDTCRHWQSKTKGTEGDE